MSLCAKNCSLLVLVIYFEILIVALIIIFLAVLINLKIKNLPKKQKISSSSPKKDYVQLLLFDETVIIYHVISTFQFLDTETYMVVPSQLSNHSFKNIIIKYKVIKYLKLSQKRTNNFISSLILDIFFSSTIPQKEDKKNINFLFMK